MAHDAGSAAVKRMRVDGRRRRMLACGVATAAALVARPLAAAAYAGPLPASLREAYGDRAIRFERVRLDIPALAENGNSVPVTIDVDSPMTDADHIARIEVFAPENPVPRLIGFELTPACGAASVEARVRLADSQRIFVVAETGNGRLLGASAEVVVTVAACLDTFTG